MSSPKMTRMLGRLVFAGFVAMQARSNVCGCAKGWGRGGRWTTGKGSGAACGGRGWMSLPGQPRVRILQGNPSGRTGGPMGGTGPIEALRNLTLSLQRMVATEIATGVVRGTADGLREEVPDGHGQLHTLLQDLLTVLGRMAHEAAEREPG